jgi:hypothetical protein
VTPVRFRPSTQIYFIFALLNDVPAPDHHTCCLRTLCRFLWKNLPLASVQRLAPRMNRPIDRRVQNPVHRYKRCLSASRLLGLQLITKRSVHGDTWPIPDTWNLHLASAASRPTNICNRHKPLKQALRAPLQQSRGDYLADAKHFTLTRSIYSEPPKKPSILTKTPKAALGARSQLEC